MARAHAIVKEELPDASTSGWLDEDCIYDVFAPAQQHREGPVYYMNYRAKNNKPLLLAEYGDWEYYAVKEANFDQVNLGTSKREERTLRQRRYHGER